MKQLVLLLCIFFPAIMVAQIKLSAGAALGNRWDEALNSQTLGKGFRVSAENFISDHFSIGIGISYFSFDPNSLVNVSFNSYVLKTTYYFTKTLLQPYLGVGVGFTHYADKTKIVLGQGNTNTQTRNKNYGVVSPFLGLHFSFHQQSRFGIFTQLNADFVPVATIDPIGFISGSVGITYRLSRK